MTFPTWLGIRLQRYLGVRELYILNNRMSLCVLRLIDSGSKPFSEKKR